jgi:hypothetical protein
MIQEDSKTKSLEEIFDKVLQFREEGKSFKEILDMFPEHQKEIQELLGIAEIIKKEKTEIVPSKELLDKILSQIDILSITKPEESRYIYREKLAELKGRLSINQVFNVENILNFMSKKVYILAGVAVIAIVIAVGIYWYSQKAEISVSPESQELAYETESLSQDITELEEIGQNTDPETLEEDLLTIGEEVSEVTPKTPTPAGVKVSVIENLEEELDAELDGFGTDLTDLEGFEGDTSLDNLDNSLSGF